MTREEFNKEYVKPHIKILRKIYYLDQFNREGKYNLINEYVDNRELGGLISIPDSKNGCDRYHSRNITNDRVFVLTYRKNVHDYRFPETIPL